MAFLRKFFNPKEQPAPQPLAIAGIQPAPVTPEPDDAELAAAALLEAMAATSGSPDGESKKQRKEQNPSTPGEDVRGLVYYRALAERIREAHHTAALRATRFVAACEYMLQDKQLPYYGKGSLGMLEAELYKRIDIIEREGGELKQRWQHCLAEVTVRMMNSTPPEEKPYTDNTEKKDGRSSTLATT